MKRRPRPFSKKLDSVEPLITGQRIADTFFPVAKGGTVAIPTCPRAIGDITFFDLFAGIGGFRLALERIGWTCVGYCEVDRFCWRTYEANFDTRGEFFWPDARTLPTEEMPNFDVLVAGFPCQPFSTAGKRRGFEDARGTLVYEIFRILDAKRPRAFLLENVKGLVCKPMRDREFKRIITVLAEELKYQVFWRVLNSKNYGVPQNRERVFIVGFMEHRPQEFMWPEPAPLTKRLADVLECDVPEKYYLSGRMVETLARHLERHKAKGHGFGARIFNSAGRERNSVANTLSARYYKDGSENLVAEGRSRYDTDMSRSEIGEAHRRIRRLTPRECARLQGFPDSFVFPVSDSQAYRQLGNAVTVPVVEAVGRAMEGWFRG